MVFNTVSVATTVVEVDVYEVDEETTTLVVVYTVVVAATTI